MGGADLGQEPVNRGRRFEPGVRLRTSQNYLWVERLLCYTPTRAKNVSATIRIKPPPLTNTKHRSKTKRRKT